MKEGGLALTPRWMHDWVTLAVSGVSVASALGYVSAYFDAVGQRIVTGMPWELIEFSWLDATQAGLRSLPGLVGLGAFMWANTALPTRSRALHLAAVAGSLFVFLSPVARSSLDYVMVLFAALVLAPMLLRRAESSPVTTESIAKHLVAGLIVLATISFFCGMLRIEREDSYWVIPAQAEDLAPWVVLHMSREHAVVAELDRVNARFERRFKVVALREVSPRLERIGPLRPYEPFDVCWPSAEEPAIVGRDSPRSGSTAVAEMCGP